MYFLFFILGGICGVITTSLLAARAINETEKETFDRCLNDAKRSFGRGWKENTECENVVSLDGVIDTIEWYRTNPQHFTEDNLIEDIKGLPFATLKKTYLNEVR